MRMQPLVIVGRVHIVISHLSQVDGAEPPCIDLAQLHIVDIAHMDVVEHHEVFVGVLGFVLHRHHQQRTDVFLFIVLELIVLFPAYSWRRSVQVVDFNQPKTLSNLNRIANHRANILPTYIFLRIFFLFSLHAALVEVAGDVQHPPIALDVIQCPLFTEIGVDAHPRGRALAKDVLNEGQEGVDVGLVQQLDEGCTANP